MSSIVDEEAGIQETLQVDKIVARAAEEAVNLRVVEKFLSEVERGLLKISPRVFDTEPVKRCLQRLKSATEDSVLEEIWQAEFQLQQELYLWRNLLEERDKHIEAYHFRRFCDGAKEAFEPAVYVALTLFYRNLAYSSSSQSKFDLFATRVFTREYKNGRRKMTASRAAVADQLRSLFAEWGFEDPVAADNGNDVDAGVAGIDSFTTEAESVANFEQLVQSNMLERYRVFKRELGKRFFCPQIVAAAIECNVTVGNIFNALLEKENEALGTKLTAEFDFAGALSDTSPDAQNHISDYLQEISVFEGSTSGNEDIDYLWKLLDHAGVAPLTAENKYGVEADTQSPYAFDAPSAEERLAPYFQILSTEKPDTRALREYMQKFESLTILDLNDFLHMADGSPDFLCRRALGVILWSEEIRETEFQQQKVLSTLNKQEIIRLFQKSDELAGQIEDQINAADQDTQNRLLTVLNRLLESRLKLERAVVRISNRSLERFDLAAHNFDLGALETPEKEVPYVAPRRSVSPWLVMAFLLVALLSGGIYYVANELNAGIPLPEDVERLTVSALPNAVDLKVAYRQKSTLYVTAYDSWRELPVNEKEKGLREMLNYPSPTKIDTVVVMDGTGRPLGDISPEGIHIIDEMVIVDQPANN